MKRLLHCLLGLKRGHSCSDDEEEVVAVAVLQEVVASEEIPHCRGSVLGRQTVLRGHVWDDAQLYADYFCDQPVYSDDTFRRK